MVTQAFGINNLGTIVGTYTDARGVQHGFVVQTPP
jgi:probable HAF family extracellular repeat protein